jgi:hypothetical protein
VEHSNRKKKLRSLGADYSNQRRERENAWSCHGLKRQWKKEKWRADKGTWDSQNLEVKNRVGQKDSWKKQINIW